MRVCAVQDESDRRSHLFLLTGVVACGVGQSDVAPSGTRRAVCRKRAGAGSGDKEEPGGDGGQVARMWKPTARRMKPDENPASPPQKLIAEIGAALHGGALGGRHALDEEAGTADETEVPADAEQPQRREQELLDVAGQRRQRCRCDKQRGAYGDGGGPPAAV